MEQESPFFVGKPILPGSFKGRSSEIENLERKLRQSFNHNAKYILIKGDRGIGKTSLANFIMEFSRDKFNALPIYVSIANSITVEEVIFNIIERIGIEFHKTIGLKEKFKDFFGDSTFNISSDLLGLLNVSINKSFAKRHFTVTNFALFFQDIVSKVMEKTKWKGILLILDDINGISKEYQFAGLLKSFTDELSIKYPKLNFALVICSVEENWNNIIKSHESVQRIYDHIDLFPMTAEDVKSYYEFAYSLVNITINTEILDQMVEVTRGYPAIVQELGEAIFYADNDNFIDKKDYFTGLSEAIEQVGRKYLHQSIIEIKSDEYRKIFIAIANNLKSTAFMKKELKEWIGTSISDSSLSHFLKKFKDKGLFISGSVPGQYYFKNPLILFYIFNFFNPSMREKNLFLTNSK